MDGATILVRPEAAPDRRVTLRAGDLSVELAPALGGRLSALRRETSGGAIDLVPPLGPWRSEPRSWPKEGAYPLFPYSNRIRDAVLHHAGRSFALRPHPASAPHALHGPAHLRPWQVVQADETAAVLMLDYAADADWPWAFRAWQTFTVSANGLMVELAIRNDAAEAVPAGMGWHPYFTAGRTSRFQHDARRLWRINADHITDGTSGAYAGEVADNLYLSEWSKAALVHPDGSGVTLSADPSLGHLILHRPAVGDYACIEPVSHVADGFNLAAAGIDHTGLVVLEPGETLSGRLKVALLPAAQTQ